MKRINITLLRAIISLTLLCGSVVADEPTPADVIASVTASNDQPQKGDAITDAISDLRQQRDKIAQQLLDNATLTTEEIKTLQKEKADIESLLTTCNVTVNPSQAESIAQGVKLDMEIVEDKETETVLFEAQTNMNAIENFFRNDAALSIEDSIALNEVLWLCKEKITTCKTYLRQASTSDKNAAKSIRIMIGHFNNFLVYFQNARLRLELCAVPVPLSSEQDAAGFLSLTAYHSTCAKVFIELYDDFFRKPKFLKRDIDHDHTLIRCCPVTATRYALRKIMRTQAATHLESMPYYTELLRINPELGDKKLIAHDYLELVTTYYKKNPLELIIQQANYGKRLEQIISECFELLSRNQGKAEDCFVLQRMLDTLIAIKTDFDRISITTVKDLSSSNVKMDIFVRYQILVHSKEYQAFARTSAALDQSFVKAIESFFKGTSTPQIAWFKTNATKSELQANKMNHQKGFLPALWSKQPAIVDLLDRMIEILDACITLLKAKSSGEDAPSFFTGLAAAAIGVAPVIADKLKAFLDAEHTGTSLPLPDQQDLASFLQTYPKIFDELCKNYPAFSQLRKLSPTQAYTPLFGTTGSIK